MKCPGCGRELGIGAEMLQRMEEGAGAGAGAEWWKKAPVRAPQLKSDVGVNLGLATSSFVLISIGSVILAVVSGYWDGLRYGMALAVAVGLVTWFWLLIDGRGLLRQTERVRPGPGMSDNGGTGVTVRKRVRSEIAEGPGRVVIDDIETLEEQQLILVARRVVAGAAFSRRSLTPACFGGELYPHVRREMLDRGFVRSVGGGVNSRVLVTKKGQALFDALS